MNVVSNATKLGNKFKRRANAVTQAITKGLRNAVIKIDNAQAENLSGGDTPGDYPIPVRTGNLLQGRFFKIKSGSLALVGNTASYALPIHEGTASYSTYDARPFLDDAVESVDVQGEVRGAMAKAVFAL